MLPTIFTEKLPKRSFRARLPRNFTEEASKMIVSCEASSKFHRTMLPKRTFRAMLPTIFTEKLPKRSFRARLPRNFTEQAAKKIVSCEASSKFHRTSCQKDRFVRGFLEISQNKLPKRSFRARLPRNFTAEARKINVSCDASDNFHRTSFQNERFARCFRQFSQKKLPKWSFHARLPPNFIEQCFQNERFARCFRQFSQKSFQNDRFVRGFLEISQKKLAKSTFRAMLPTIFTEQASKTSVSHDASDNFHRKSFQNDRFMRGFLQIS